MSVCFMCSGHWSIIQVLSRKGIYAVGSDSVDVTETILMQSAPFKLVSFRSYTHRAKFYSPYRSDEWFCRQDE